MSNMADTSYTIKMNNAIQACHLITTQTSDGILLDGAWFHPEETQCGAIVIHGKAQNFYTAVARWVAPHLASLGFSSIALNMRDHDHGDIDGIPVSALDIQAGVDFLTRKGCRSILLVGISYGSNKAALFVQEAKKNNINLSGLILMSAGSVESYLPQVWADDLHSISQLTEPLLVVQAKADEFISEPELRGQDILRVASQCKAKKLVVVDKADHGFTQQREEVTTQISSWIRASIAPE